MALERRPSRRAKRLAVLVPVVLIALPVAYGVAAALATPGADPSAPFLEMPAPEHRLCVEDRTADEMRYHHMDLLKRIRDRVLREGDRQGVSFDDCKTCHTSRERFCNRCHERVDLTPDCFGCHDYP